MSNLSEEFIQRCREDYAALTRSEGADYFEAMEAIDQSVMNARLRHREQLRAATSVNDLAPEVLTRIGEDIESGARDSIVQALSELDESKSARRAAAIRLAQCECPPMRRIKTMECIDFILDPLPHILTLCEGRRYPQVLFWKDKLVTTLSYVQGLARRNNESGNEFEADANRLWLAINEMCAPTPAATLPYLDTVVALGGREDSVDGLRIVFEATALIHEIGATYAIPPKPADASQSAHPGRQFPLSKIGPVKEVTWCVLCLHTKLCIIRTFLTSEMVNHRNVMLAIGFLGSHDSSSDWSILVATIDSLLGRTDVPYDGLMLREGRSPYIYYNHAPMHRYGRAQARPASLRGMLDAGNRFIAAAEEYLMTLRLRSAEALMQPLRETREAACALAALDADI
jgi:hypothetical protein